MPAPTTDSTSSSSSEPCVTVSGGSGSAVTAQAHDDSPPHRVSRYPAIVHVAVISAFLLPIAIFPYLASRRKIGALRRQLGQMQHELGRLQGDLEVSKATQTLVRNELGQVLTTVNKAVAEADTLRNEIGKAETKWRDSIAAIQSEVHSLSAESQHLRTQAITLRALGMSLADIAAFMQEVELGLGLEARRRDLKDPRGIEKLRLLALRMQSLPHSDKPHPTPARESSIGEPF